MASESAQLVKTIRERRHHWSPPVGKLTAEARESIRHRPLAWVVGGVVAGFVAYKAVQNRRAPAASPSHSWVKQALGRGLAAAAVASLQLLRQRGRHSEHQNPTEPAAVVERSQPHEA